MKRSCPRQLNIFPFSCFAFISAIPKFVSNAASFFAFSFSPLSFSFFTPRSFDIKKT